MQNANNELAAVFEAILSWIDKHQGFTASMLALASFVSSIAAVWISRSANKLAERNLNQAIALDKARSRAYLVFDIQHEQHIANASLRNLGLTAALNVRVVCEPPLTDEDHNGIRRIALTEQTIAFFAPGRHTVDFIDSSADFSRRFGSVVFKGFIEYDDIDGNHHSEPFLIDQNYEMKRIWISTPDTPREVAKAAKSVVEIARLANRAVTLLKNHVQRGEDSSPTSPVQCSDD